MRFSVDLPTGTSASTCSIVSMRRAPFLTSSISSTSRSFLCALYVPQATCLHCARLISCCSSMVARLISADFAPRAVIDRRDEDRERDFDPNGDRLGAQLVPDHLVQLVDGF